MKFYYKKNNVNYLNLFIKNNNEKNNYFINKNNIKEYLSKYYCVYSNLKYKDIYIFTLEKII